ncbi:MAG: recombinase family protein, partial [Oscillospiraceae bacterium]|nr:recombinase family protein [Oscillospiraceae bacterium]
QLRNNVMTEWTPRTVKGIIINPLYVGDLVQNRRSRISYKNRKLRENPKEKWIVVKNTHEPLIDRDAFNALQKMAITQKYARNEKKRTSLLDGLLFCYECKFKIGLKYAKARDTVYITCNNYRKNSKLRICTPHQFKYYDLEIKVVEVIKNVFKYIDSQKIESNIINNDSIINYDREMEKLKKEIGLISGNIDKMYIDKLSNKITEEMYERVYSKLKKDVEYKERQYQELEKNSKQNNNQDLEKVIKEFLKLKELTPDFIRIIINKIEIHQDKEVDIIFNFKELNYYANNLLCVRHQ